MTPAIKYIKTKDAVLHSIFKKRKAHVEQALSPFIRIPGAKATKEEMYIPGNVVIFESH